MVPNKILKNFFIGLCKKNLCASKKKVRMAKKTVPVVFWKLVYDKGNIINH